MTTKMAAAFLKFFLPPPLRRPLRNLKLIPYQVPTFIPSPIHVPNQQLFVRSFTYLSHSLPRPRKPRMPTLKSVIQRRQRGTGGAKYCNCADCQGKRLLNRVPYLPSYFRRSRVPNSFYKNAGCGGQQQICKRKIHTDSRGSADDVDKGGRFWTRLRRALRATRVQWYPIPIGLGIAYIAFAHLRKMRERGWSSTTRDDQRPVNVKGSDEVRIHGPWQFYVLSTLPLRTISRLWGKFNAIELPLFMRAPGYKLYSWIFGCELDELKEPDLTKYRNLAEFFSRELRDGARVIDPSADLVSPADGKVLHFGEIEGRRVEQVKGLSYSLDTFLGGRGNASRSSQPQQIEFDHSTNKPPTYDEREFAELNGISYSLDQLLGDDEKQKAQSQKSHDASLPPEQSKDTKDMMARDVRKVGMEVGLKEHRNGEVLREGNKLYFIVIYLAPGDYHRFHSPTNWVAESRRHFAGELFSVSPYIAHRIPNLFTLNERVAILGRWRYGFLSMTPVGATNVGSIRVNFDKDLRTNNLLREKPDGSYDEATYAGSSRLLQGHALHAGEEMGGFSLGSTVILVFEAPQDKVEFCVETNGKVKVGQALFRVKRKVE